MEKKFSIIFWAIIYTVLMIGTINAQFLQSSGLSNQSNYVLSSPQATQFYNQNFDTAMGGVGDWPPGWSSTSQWTRDHYESSQGYTGASGWKNAYASGSGNAIITFQNFLLTSGYNNITVMWGAKRTTAQATPIIFEWSNDNGTNWNAITFTDVTNDNVWHSVNGGTRISIPAAALSTTYYTFRWRIADPSSYRMDDFNIQGDAAPPPPTKLKIVSISGCSNQIQINKPFSVVIWTVDNNDIPRNPTTATTIHLTKAAGSGNLTASDGIITTSQYSVTITDAVINATGLNFQITASAISGMTGLTPATSIPFSVTPGTNHLAFVNPPATGYTNTILPCIYVSAMLPWVDSADGCFNGQITLVKNSGPGNIHGTLIHNANSGIAGYTDIYFDAPGTYNLKATTTVSGVSDASSINIVITDPPGIRVLPRIILQGAANMTDSVVNMRTDLRDLGRIPANQPYNVAPWNYAGTENAGSSPAFSVDWVLIELRTSPGETNVPAARRQAGFVLKNGWVVDQTGGVMLFTAAVNGNYWLTIHHRNHLAIMSVNSLPLTYYVTVYDFTQSLSGYYCPGLTPNTPPAVRVINVGSVGCAMWAGNAKVMPLIPASSNSYKFVKRNGVNNDLTAIVSNPPYWNGLNHLTSGYFLADINMDGFVNTHLSAFLGHPSDIKYLINVLNTSPSNSYRKSYVP